MSGQAIIRATDLKKSYENLTILDVPSLEIISHQTTSIIGPSGAGKSTLLHILGTLLKPTTGEVYIHNDNISILSEEYLAEFRNRHLGFVFQQHNLLPEFTAIENVLLPARIGGFEEKTATPKAKKWLDYLGLKDRYHHKPNQLSGGEQQRVSIARALINEPKIILADEPTGNLDTKNAEEIHQLFVRLKEEMGCTFLIVTHNESLAKMADKLIVMKDGQIIE